MTRLDRKMQGTQGAMAMAMAMAMARARAGKGKGRQGLVPKAQARPHQEREIRDAHEGRARRETGKAKVRATYEIKACNMKRCEI
jgi:hypothetical protein